MGVGQNLVHLADPGSAAWRQDRNGTDGRRAGGRDAAARCGEIYLEKMAARAFCLFGRASARSAPPGPACRPAPSRVRQGERPRRVASIGSWGEGSRALNGTKPGEVVQAAAHGGSRIAPRAAAWEAVAQRIEQREGERAGRSSGALFAQWAACDIVETEPVERDSGCSDHAGTFAILQQHRSGLWLCRSQRRQRDGNSACQDDDQPPRGGFGGTQEPQDGDIEMARQDTGAARVAARAQKVAAAWRSTPPWRQGWPGCASALRGSC